MDILVAVQRIEQRDEPGGIFVPRQTIRHYITIPSPSPAVCVAMQAAILLAGFVVLLCLP